MDAEHRQWLKSLVPACERVLDRTEGDRTDGHYALIRADVAALLARLRAELDVADA
jgi:hypothetical protein